MAEFDKEFDWEHHSESASGFDPESMAKSVPESKSEYVAKFDPEIDFNFDFDAESDSQHTTR